MNVRTRCFAALAPLLLLAASPARAQAPSRESAAPSWLRAPSTRGPIASVLAFDGRWAYGSVAAGMPVGARLRSLTSADAPGALLPGFSVNAMLSASGQPGGAETSPSWLHAALLVDRSGPRSGGWLGVASGEGVTGTSQVRYRVGAGAWRAIRSVQFECSIVTSVIHDRQPAETDTVPAMRDDSTYVLWEDRLSRWLSGLAAARWQTRRAELEASAGITAGDGAAHRGWAQAAMTYQLSRHALLLASFGTRPAVALAFDATARPRSMVGVQWAPWASPKWAMAQALRPSMRDWVARGAGAGRLAIFLRCRDSHRVELAGDFTDWLATPLEPTDGGWWRLVVPIDPGLHRVRVRLDNGAWEVPPGLPRAAGDGDSPAGVLLVE
jgi:hypothetical protein